MVKKQDKRRASAELPAVAATEPFDQSDAKWGQASEKRGISNLQLAIDFVTAFPIGTSLTAKEFDEWAKKSELLKVPSSKAGKQSDAWKAHITRRNELRGRINHSGTHPRLADHGATPFSLDFIHGFYQVRAPLTAIAMFTGADKVNSLVKHKRKQLAYLMQSADWNVLPAYERVVAMGIYTAIDRLGIDTNTAASRIHEDIDIFAQRLRKLEQAGIIKSENGGLTQLLLPLIDDDNNNNNNNPIK